MKPIFWFILGLVVALGGQAAAEFVDRYGNPQTGYETYRQQPGGSTYREPDGSFHYQSVPPAQRNPC